jgi:hypothetical protein
LGVEAGIVGIAGVIIGIEVIGTSCEEVLEEVVDPRRAGADKGVTGSVNQGSEAPEERAGAEGGSQSKRQTRSGGVKLMLLMLPVLIATASLAKSREWQTGTIV